MARIVCAVLVLGVLASGLLFYGCPISLPGAGTPTPGGQTGVVMCRLTDPSGNALSNVTMSLGGVTGTSNEQGYVVLQGITPRSAGIATLRRNGYVQTVRPVDVIGGDTVTFDATLLPVGTTQTINTATANQVMHNGGGIRIPANGVVNAAGTPVSSAIVTVTTARPSDAGYTSVFPGPFIGQRASDQQVGNLRSYGFVDVTIEDASGNPLQLASGNPAEIMIPIDPNMDPGTGTVPLWYLDRTQGMWIEEGSATRDEAAGVYRGNIAHLTPWNLDVWYTRAYKRVTVQDGNGDPVVGAYVVVDGPSWRSTGYTSITGQVTLGVQPLTQIRVWAQKGTVITAPVTESSGAAGTTTDNVITMAPALATITLTWGQAPSDLDSHLSIPTTPDRFHIFYNNKGTLTASPWAALDTDDVTSYGPEVITLTRLLPGTYRYGVHNYSGQTTTPIEQSGAKVTLVAPGGIMRSWDVPTSNPDSANNNFWIVFELVVDQSGSLTLTSINTFGPYTTNIHPAGMPPSAKEETWLK